MKFKKIGTGFAKPNAKSTPNNKHPEFIGTLTINEEELSIALWKKQSYGKETFAIQVTKGEDTKTIRTIRQEN
tara:strand:- start:3247 stop:3465 length:219 start_codon:yes stop_codon:yes gene_type:complete